MHAIAKGLAAIEAIVAAIAPAASNLFAAGTESPSIADVCLIPQIYNAKRMGVDLTPFPTICAIADRCETMPAFQAAAPQNQPDAKN